MASYDRRAFMLGALAGAASIGCGFWPKTRTPTLPAAAKAPSFRLPDQTGKEHALADLTARGPALLVFYRGYW